jgi:uncharacterized protein (UPF0333 family)
MKGQSSLELMVTVGIVLAFTVPVLFLMMSVTSVGYEDTTKAQADASARTLADAMNLVYSQGSGAQRDVLLNVPATTQSISAQNNEVVITIKTAAGVFEAASPTIAKIVAKPPMDKKTGLVRIIVKNNNGKVELIDPTAP